MKQKTRILCELLISMRPKQWTKNVFVLAGVVFSRELKSGVAIAESLLAFALFCMVSSAVYLINDLVDIERDRAHPVKRTRPLAAGRLQPRVALIAATLLVIGAVPMGFFLLNVTLGAVLLVYFGLMLAYSFLLKNIVIIDVFTIAFGFVLRAVGGAVAINVSISNWLLVCTILIALFIGLAKRRHELLLLDNTASGHRRILQEYSPAVLEEMISVVSSSTVIAYSLYTFFGPAQEETIPYPYTYRIPYMMLTIPFVIYAIFRYMYLVYQKNKGGSPEEILLRDLPFLVNLLLWGISVLLILYAV